MLITAIILVFLLCLSALFAGAETALFMVMKDRQLMSDEKRLFGEHSAILKIALDPNRLLMSVLLSNLLVNLVFFALSTIFVMEVEKNIDASAGVMVGAFFLMVVIVFGEILPKTLASIVPLAFSRRTAGFIYRLMRVLRPLVDGLNLILLGVNRLLGLTRKEDAPSPQDFQNFVGVSGREGWLEGMHGEVMVTVMELHQLQLKVIRTPRVDVHSLREDEPLSKVREKSQEWGLTLLPLYREHHDDTESYIDTVRLMGSVDEQAPAKTMAYHLPVFSDLSRMDFVLREFLEKELRLALTVNEYGEMSGLVTWNDVMKCLIKKVTLPWEGEQRALMPMDGRSKVRDLEMFSGFQVEDAVTLGGWICAKLERIPKQGESVDIEGIQMLISRATTRGVKEVMIIKPLAEEVT
jgi:putative hemolysin